MPNTINDLKESLMSLPKQEYLIAKTILDNPLEAAKGSIMDLADKSNASTATAIRLAKRMGFPSYREFMRQIYLEALSSLNYSEDILSMEDVVSGQTMEETIKRIEDKSVQAIIDSAKVLSPHALSQTVNFLNNARKVIFFGVGGSTIPCIDACSKFKRLGMDASFYESAHDMVVAATLLKKGDVAVFFSYSGESRELLKPLKIAKEEGAVCIAVTSNADSILSQMVDFSIVHGSIGDGIRTNSTLSRLIQLNVIDILFAQLSSLRVKQLEEFHEITNSVFLGDKNLGKVIKK